MFVSNYFEAVSDDDVRDGVDDDGDNEDDDGDDVVDDDDDDGDFCSIVDVFFHFSLEKISGVLYICFLYVRVISCC